MVNKISLFALLYFFVNNAYSQPTLDTSREVIGNTKSIFAYDLRSKEVIGSVYIDEDFSTAKFLNDERVYLMRYNAYLDEMELMKNGTPFYISKPLGLDIFFSKLKKNFKIYEFTNKNKIVKGFFRVVFEGEELTLLIKDRIQLRKDERPQTSYVKHQPLTLVRAKDKFYIGYKNFTAIELPKRKKEILALFSLKSKAIEKYVKSNKLSFKKKEDLIKIFEYYNSL